MTTKAKAISLTKSNLHSVFAERNSTIRRTAIANVWGSSSILFVDPTTVATTAETLNDVVDKILATADPSFVFTELSDVETLEKDEVGDVWVTRVRWGFGPPGGEYVLQGMDVVTVVGGKIEVCYAFLDSK